MEKINWENGSIVKDAYVTIDGTEYVVTPEEIEGTTPLDADNLNLLQENIEAEFENFQTQKVLWQGDYMMSSNATAYLSENITDQKHGIVLVWSGYASGAQDYDYHCFFVPKHFVKMYPGRGITNILANVTGNKFSVKYVYVHNNRIVGNDNNTTDRNTTEVGIKYTNRSFVLRYVIGV